MIGKMIDIVFEGINFCKIVYIISDKYEDIKNAPADAPVFFDYMMTLCDDDIETFENDWKPYRTKFRPTAQFDEEGKIIKVHHNARVFEIEYNLRDSAVSHAVRQKSKCHGKIFKYIDEETYYKLKPIKLVF